VNTPREVVTAVRKKGFAKLTPEEAAHIPARIDTASADHRKLFRAFFKDGDASHSSLSDKDWDAMFEAQCTWDATMAKNAVDALKREPDRSAIMVVLIGHGHVAYGLGAERQARQWFDGRIASLVALPVEDDKGKPVTVRASYANFVWATPPESPTPAYAFMGLGLSDRAGEKHPVVAQVAEKSSAERAGIKIEDRVTALDDVPMPDRETFMLHMAGRRWGESVRVTLMRDGKPLTLAVPLRRAPSAPAK
jgi:predicted metalloprotease with PDZ domain